MLVSVCPNLDESSDSREARLEFGEKMASQLKLTKDGSKVLWPQPADVSYPCLYSPYNIDGSPCKRTRRTRKTYVPQISVRNATLKLDIVQWSSRKKTLQLVIWTMAAIIPDFDSGIGTFVLCAHTIKSENLKSVFRYRRYFCSRCPIRYDYRCYQQPHIQVCLFCNTHKFCIDEHLVSFSWSIFLVG